MAHVSFVLLFSYIGQCIAKIEAGDTFVDCIHVRSKQAEQDIHCFDRHLFYRTFDGTCNNRHVKGLGASFSELQRMTDPFYVDSQGADTPRGFLHTPNAMKTPPANEVSKILFHVEKKNMGNPKKLSTLFMTFGQFLDHDLVDTQQGICIRKCGGDLSWRYPCFPILFEKNKTRCTPLSRTKASCKQSNMFGKQTARQQVNTVTSYIDGSQIYGSSVIRGTALREFSFMRRGEMRTTHRDLIPVDHRGFSLVGDTRGDNNIALLALHTVWVREHNRIARIFRHINPFWNHDRVFNEARKLVVGILQHIIYNEYLPVITQLSDYKGYDEHTNPSVFNAFSTAAFRYGHSLIPEFFEQLDENYNVKSRALSVREVLLNIIPILVHGIEPTMFGLLGSQSSGVDRGFCESVGRNLFVPTGISAHVDLAAINIQRGRDHGLPPYGKWRELCGLKKVETWEELIEFMPEDAVTDFKKVYDHPNNIDLFAAGISEHHLEPFEVGPTFSCIIKKQFESSRNGDRFYYEAANTFTASQRKEIKKVTMARILCDNLKGIKTIQRNAFFVSEKSNPRVTCDKIKRLSFHAW